MNVYIWNDTWLPWSNTIAYYPLTSNDIDSTWNTSLTSTGTQDGIGRKFTSATILTYPTATPVQYVNVWMKINSYYTSWEPSSVLIMNNLWTWYYLWHNTDKNINKKIFVWTNSSFSTWWTKAFEPAVWTWHNVSWWYDWTKTICSIDWVVTTLYNGKGYNFWTGIWIVWTHTANITFSNLIFEKQWWTSDQIQLYYNQTKSNYWL